jgi:hypothetical protein
MLGSKPMPQLGLIPLNPERVRAKLPTLNDTELKGDNELHDALCQKRKLAEPNLGSPAAKRMEI